MKDATFIGRRYELSKIKELYNRRVASLAVVRGRRRIGKSRLVIEAAKGIKLLQFSGLAPEPGMTAQHQRDEFAIQLSQQTNLPEVKADDWSKIFKLLADKVKSGRLIILFDEITWMAHDDPTFLSKLKNAWDTYFSKNNKLTLILCGSVSAWIEKNIINSTNFLGRVSLDLILQNLPLIECNQLLDALGFKRSTYEKMIYLSLTGCIPWYIEQVNPMHSAEDNIKNLCFEPNALMVKEFNRVFHDLFGRRGEIYKKIVQILVSRSLDYTTIAKKLDYAKGSALTDYLNELETSGYIKQYHTWLMKDASIGSISQYRLADNYLRFYFKYILPKIASIEAGRYKDITIDQLPGWKSILGLQFENLILNNRELIIENLGIQPSDVLIDNPYFQKATSRRKGCQIDYLIQTRLKTLFACEIKFSNKISTSSVIREMNEKLSALSLPRGFAVLPVLIHFCDIDVEIADEFFYKTIDIRDIINPQ